MGLARMACSQRFVAGAEVGEVAKVRDKRSSLAVCRKDVGSCLSL